MTQLLHPLFAMLASLTRQELARQVAYLKEENRILRARLPGRIVTTPRERSRLLKVGRKLGTQLKELVSIVGYKTFRRWVREVERRESPEQATTVIARCQPGRPRTADEIRELVLKLARENAWGYTRILGELRKLGVSSISGQTVKNILKEHGIDPGPKRGVGTWDEFLTSHAETLWQCDFISKKSWTLRGFVDLYFLVFIHLGTRRVWTSTCTRSPDTAWVSQQARNFLMSADDSALGAKYVIRDNDGKFQAGFDDVLEAGGCQVIRATPMSPNLRAHVEWVVQTLQHDALDAFVVVNEKHLNYIVRTVTRWYNEQRPHSVMGYPAPSWDRTREPPTTPLRVNDIVCTTQLGGVLKSYARRAA